MEVHSQQDCEELIQKFVKIVMEEHPLVKLMETQELSPRRGDKTTQSRTENINNTTQQQHTTTQHSNNNNTPQHNATTNATSSAITTHGYPLLAAKRKPRPKSSHSSSGSGRESAHNIPFSKTKSTDELSMPQLNLFPTFSSRKKKINSGGGVSSLEALQLENNQTNSVGCGSQSNSNASSSSVRRKPSRPPPPVPLSAIRARAISHDDTANNNSTTSTTQQPQRNGGSNMSLSQGAELYVPSRRILSLTSPRVAEKVSSAVWVSATLSDEEKEKTTKKRAAATEKKKKKTTNTKKLTTSTFLAPPSSTLSSSPTSNS